MNINKKREVLRKAQRQYEKIQKKKKKENDEEQQFEQVQQEQADEDMEEEYEDIEDDDENQMPDTDFEDEFDDEYEKMRRIKKQKDLRRKLKRRKDFNQKRKKIKRKLKCNQFQKGRSRLNKFNVSQLCFYFFAEMPEKRAWFNDGIKEEHLDFDNRAYNMLHRVNTEWPCLSCDYILPEAEMKEYKQKKFLKMDKYPYTVYLAAGTQADKPSKNEIYLMKLSKLHKTKYDDDEDSDRDDPEDEDIQNDEEGFVQLQSVVGLKNGINRIKTLDFQPIVAYWSENGDVTILDLTQIQKNLEQDDDSQNKKKSTFNINQLFHKSFSNQSEGFAIDWSKLKYGQLATGSNDRKIYIYEPKEEGMADIIRASQPYTFHNDSVEDIQFSPIESFAFASCSVDGTLRVTDLRVGNKSQSQITIQAHNCDVNVLSWNQTSTNLIATGADDGIFKVWDLRYPKAQKSISEIQFHSKPITSIQFQPNSDSTLTVTSADNKLSIWDFAVENDEVDEVSKDVPDQLMFVHQGQKDLKELRYHPVYYEMIVSTSANGFNIFKPSLDEESSNQESEEDQEEIKQIKEGELDEYLAKLSLKD